MLIRWIGSICTAIFRLMATFAWELSSSEKLKENKPLTYYRQYGRPGNLCFKGGGRL